MFTFPLIHILRPVIVPQAVATLSEFRGSRGCGRGAEVVAVATVFWHGVVAALLAKWRQHLSCAIDIFGPRQACGEGLRACLKKRLG